MPRIVSYDYPEVIEVGVDVGIYRPAEDDAPGIMLTAFHGDHTEPIPLDANQAEAVALALTKAAAELHALEVQQ